MSTTSPYGSRTIIYTVLVHGIFVLRDSGGISDSQRQLHRLTTLNLYKKPLHRSIGKINSLTRQFSYISSCLSCGMNSTPLSVPGMLTGLEHSLTDHNTSPAYLMSSTELGNSMGLHPTARYFRPWNLLFLNTVSIIGGETSRLS